MKSRLKTFSLAVFLLTVGLTTLPTASHACKCVEEKSVEKELKTSKAVFSGKVIDIHNKNNKRKILFEVEDTWQGVSQTELILDDEWSSCSIDFSKGESYLVYAYEFQGKLTTNICDRTKELSSAGEDIATLGKGVAPSEEVDLKSEMQNPIIHYMYIWVSLIILLVLTVFFIRKRSKS